MAANPTTLKELVLVYNKKLPDLIDEGSCPIYCNLIFEPVKISKLDAKGNIIGHAHFEKSVLITLLFKQLLDKYGFEEIPHECATKELTPIQVHSIQLILNLLRNFYRPNDMEQISLEDRKEVLNHLSITFLGEFATAVYGTADHIDYPFTNPLNREKITIEQLTNLDGSIQATINREIRDILTTTIKNGDLDKIITEFNYWVESNGNIDEILNNGYSALDLAVLNKREDIVEYLLSKKANPKQEVDSGIHKGKTSIDLAAGNSIILRLLGNTEEADRLDAIEAKRQEEIKKQLLAERLKAQKEQLAEEFRRYEDIQRQAQLAKERQEKKDHEELVEKMKKEAEEIRAREKERDADSPLLRMKKEMDKLKKEEKEKRQNRVDNFNKFKERFNN